ECAPPIAGQSAETRGNRPSHHCVDLVARTVRLSREGHARRFGHAMRARVPSTAREVDAATERELIVDDDNLLVMRAADGMTIVKSEAHVAMCAPAQLPSR